MARPLSLSTLDAISRTASIPRNDRGAITAGIVHFGVGNFHRAHQAVYLDRLLNLGETSTTPLSGEETFASGDACRATSSRSGMSRELTVSHCIMPDSGLHLSDLRLVGLCKMQSSLRMRR